VNRSTVALLSCLCLSACQSAPAPAKVEASYRGRIAGAAIAELKDQGFACWLEHRRHVPGLDAPGPKDEQTRPVLFCSHWDPTPGLECVERRYAFEVDWVDANAPDVMMVEQLRSRTIKRELYKCVPPGKDAVEKAEVPPALPVESIAAPAQLDGRTVAETLALMRADHFACALEYRSPSVIVSCSRWDPSPERGCIEERVVFDIAWPDPSGDPLEQLGTAHVVGQAFRCSPNWNRPGAK
jgi:hypothetical protein